jgi:hypothetical protein
MEPAVTQVTVFRSHNGIFERNVAAAEVIDIGTERERDDHDGGS